MRLPMQVALEATFRQGLLKLSTGCMGQVEVGLEQWVVTRLLGQFPVRPAIYQHVVIVAWEGVV